MKKNEKKLSKTKRDNLRFIVEDFLEKDKKELLNNLGKAPDKSLEYFSKLNSILSKGFYFPGDPDEEDIMDADFGKIVTDIHKLLRPVWNKIKKNLISFQENVLPGREAHLKLKSNIKNVNSSASELLDYSYNPADNEKKYELKFRAPMMKYDMYFETGNIKFLSVPNQQLNNFFEFVEGIPISYFSRCAFSKCKKVIILTSSDKKHCTGTNCAARKFQKEKREKDPKGTKAKDKERYHTKRKKIKRQN